jgi:hypothetical protein
MAYFSKRLLKLFDEFIYYMIFFNKSLNPILEKLATYVKKLIFIYNIVIYT